MKIVKLKTVFFLLIIIPISCSINSDPVPIQYGKDQCDYCRMTISNPNFGAELLTSKGRVYKYDAAECLVNAIHDGSHDFSKLFAVAYDDPKALHEVSSLNFLISPDFRSPMGANLTAFKDSSNLDKKYYHQLITWEELIETL